MLSKSIGNACSKGKRQVMERPLPLRCGGMGLASASVGEAVVVVVSSSYYLEVVTIVML